MKRLLPIVLCLTLPTLIGCGGGTDLNLVPVSGVVTTKEGKPVKDASVAFTPKTSKMDAPTSIGKTDDEGRFTLATIDGNEGALIGEHSVSITINIEDEDDDTGESLQELIPKEYNSETTLKFMVPEGGSDSATFQVVLLDPK